MNVLVAGGAGYIGSVCVEELLNAGHEVTVFDNLTEGHRKAVDNRAVFIQGRLSDEGAVNQAVKDSKCECILHFAANALVGESMTNPGKYFGNNVAAGLNLLNAAVEARVHKFVFSSTCATYGPPERVPMTEDLPQRPINPYGESKLMFEKMLLWYEQIHQLEFVAFRYFNAAGASERFGPLGRDVLAGNGAVTRRASSSAWAWTVSCRALMRSIERTRAISAASAGSRIAAICWCCCRRRGCPTRCCCQRALSRPSPGSRWSRAGCSAFPGCSCWGWRARGRELRGRWTGVPGSSPSCWRSRC